MAKANKKGPGRPKGAAGQKHEFERNEKFNKFRCSLGFKNVVQMLVAGGHYKSQVDVLHDAVQRLAYSRDVEIEHYHLWRGKIQ